MSVYNHIIEHYDTLFPLAQEKVDFVLQEDRPAQSILDIGCATGLLCDALKDKGHRLVGVDSDKAIIEKAMARHSHLLDFKCLDLSQIGKYFITHSFNQILCFDNTLARLPNEMAIRNLFKQIFDLTKKGGSFKGQLVNYNKVVQDGILDLPIVETETMIFKRHQCLEQQCMECYTQVSAKDGSETLTHCIPLFPIKKEQIEDLLLEAGFSLVTFYDDYKLTPYTGFEIYLVFEAKKRA